MISKPKENLKESIICRKRAVEEIEKEGNPTANLYFYYLEYSLDYIKI
jgi:hypothetical protein